MRGVVPHCQSIGGGLDQSGPTFVLSGSDQSGVRFLRHIQINLFIRMIVSAVRFVMWFHGHDQAVPADIARICQAGSKTIVCSSSFFGISTTGVP
jgi:hypothetical protein